MYSVELAEPVTHDVQVVNTSGTVRTWSFNNFRSTVRVQMQFILMAKRQITMVIIFVHIKIGL